MRAKRARMLRRFAEALSVGEPKAITRKAYRELKRDDRKQREREKA